MAKIEFFTLDIVSTDTLDYLEYDLANYLKDKVDSFEEESKICKNNNCSAVLSNYMMNEYSEETEVPLNYTFDFAKLRKELVNSVIVSSPTSDTDTFDELNKKTLELTFHSEEEIEQVKNIVNENITFEEILNKLKALNLDKFSIFKIMDDNNINKEDNRVYFKSYYYDNVLARLKKDKTFFNLMHFDNINIFSVEKNVNGFDYKKIVEYLNHHILHKDKIKCIVNKIFEDEFSDILSHSELKNFEFTYKFNENSLLDTENLNKPFFAINEYFGLQDNQIKISVNSDKDHILNNDKLVDFFNLLKETGLMKTCKVKRKNDRAFVDSTSVGSQLIYSSSLKFDFFLDTANSIFLNSYNVKYNSILDRVTK